MCTANSKAITKKIFLSITDMLKKGEKVASYKMFNSNHKKAGLPWWFSDWESTCQCKGHGFNSWSRKIPHDMQQLSPCATITEPVLHNKRSHHNKKPAHSN